MTVTVLSLAERPELRDELLGMPTTFPKFLDYDPWGRFGLEHIDDFASFQLAFIEDDRLIGRGLSVPIRWTDPLESLPPRGFDAAVELAVRGLRTGDAPTLAVALELAFIPEMQGRRLSYWGFTQLRERARSLGFSDLVGPVRPSEKHLHPHVGMSEYLARTRDDGLPTDPWLRVHVRLGGRVVALAPTSTVVSGTLQEWMEWTGIQFTSSGEVVVPGALSPIHVNVAENFAVYVEPNVWVHHDLSDQRV